MLDFYEVLTMFQSFRMDPTCHLLDESQRPDVNSDRSHLIRIGLEKLSEGLRLLQLGTGANNLLQKDSQCPVNFSISAADLGPAKVVLYAAKSFGSEPFALGDLWCRIRELFPGTEMGRAAISRQVYDLRRGARALVERVSEASLGEYRRRGRKERFYRYRPPKELGPSST